MQWALVQWGYGDKSVKNFFMEPPEKVAEWFEEFYLRYPFTEKAKSYFKTLNFEAYDLSRPLGGGFWWADKRLVQIHGAQDEAAIHELGHAFWEPVRGKKKNAKKLMDAVVRLSREQDPRYSHVVTLAGHYVNGIGEWKGFLVDGNDTEMFAGLSSGSMANLSLMPEYMYEFYSGFFGSRM